MPRSLPRPATPGTLEVSDSIPFCKSGRHHTSCHAVSKFIVWYAQAAQHGSMAASARPSALCPLDLARPRPARPEAIARCSCVSREEKKLKPQIRNITKRDELLISLPVEQQLLELKPNGSNDGNHGIPTLSSCRWDRRGALRVAAALQIMLYFHIILYHIILRALRFDGERRRDPAARLAPPQWTRCGCAVHPSRRGKRRRDQGRPQPPMARPTPCSFRPCALSPSWSWVWC